MADKPSLQVVPAAEVPIAIPEPFDLERFKVKTDPTLAGVSTLQTALPHYKLSAAKDFVRLHHDDAYWSGELCFVNVPIKGMKDGTLHLIVEEIATQFLPSAKIERFRLVLAAKPNDVFFLAHIPSRNLDNGWNSTNLQACEQARQLWTQATSRKGEGVEGYKIDTALDPDAFAPPRWPTQSLATLIGITFADCRIEHAKHPGLLRLIGAKPDVT
jgi:hypothetical protein